MRRIFFWSLIIVFIIIGVTGSKFFSEKEEKPTHIILIGWDGAQRNHVKECLNKGELPNLRQLASEGAFVDIDIIGVTDTTAGWLQILTGYNPEVTGAYSNNRYGAIPKGYTIFERLEDFFGHDNFVTAAFIGKTSNLTTDAPRRELVKEGENVDGKNIVVEDGVRYRLIPAMPFYYTKENMDIFINGLGENKNVGQKALEFLDKYKDRPFFCFLHFGELDNKGHAYGENSKEYNDALISNDIWLGNIVQKLKEVKLYEKTLIYVTADHGFDEGEKAHNSAPYVFLATNDPEIRQIAGHRVDIAPTILFRFGLRLDNVKPPLDGEPLAKPSERYR